MTNPYTFTLRIVSKAFRFLSFILLNFSDLLSRFGNDLYPYKSLNNLDIKLAKLAPELLSPSTFYIEAGANDGIEQSNTFFLEKIYGAKGILIEPSPSRFEKCLKNRSKRNIFELKALTSNDSHGIPLKFIYADLMTTGFNSVDVDPVLHTQKGLKYFNGINYEFYAEASSLSKILEAHSIFNIDLLSLDLEGAELQALKGTDLQKYKIRYILVETRSLDPIKSYLCAFNYQMLSQLSMHDYLFCRSS